MGGGGLGLTMNVELCEDNSGRSKKMRYLRKNRGRGPPPHPSSATDFLIQLQVRQGQLQLGDVGVFDLLYMYC